MAMSLAQIARILDAPYTYLALAATRFLKAIIHLNDKFYNRHIVAEVCSLGHRL